MDKWKEIVVSPETPVHEAIAKMDSSKYQFILVLDDADRLLGVLTDGDVRRAILKAINFSIAIKEVMNHKPFTLKSHTPKNEILDLMRLHNLHYIPLINKEGQVVSLVTTDELLGGWERPNWVVFMAGGLGTRLGALTKYCPKPMLKIGEKPILHLILDSFIEQGFRKFFISVNYLAEVIQKYFGDGSNFGIEIKYLHEDKRLGTAGALSLLPQSPIDPLIVINGDLLTTVNYGQMLNFHLMHQASATMAVREYDFQVPFGVVKINGVLIEGIDEKPTHRFFVNAGIYTIAPHCLEYIPKNILLDMPSLFNRLKEEGEICSAYALREKWIDIGHVNELEYAQNNWNPIFVSDKTLRVE
jgi:dTDP-glucose pyrophosphorylase